MRIAIIASGSRGDVQPYIALGKGLHKAGHTVRLMTHHNFETLVTSSGLEFWPMRGNVQEVAESEEMRALLEKGNFIAISRYTAQAAQGAAVQWAEDGLAACQGMEMLVAGLGGLFLGISLAEKLGLPLLQAYYIPFTPTKSFPGALLPQSTPRLGGRFNRLTHHATREIMWQGSRSADKLAREQVLGLPAASFWGPYGSECLRGMPVLYGYSPSVIPAPPDWGADQHVTGYWFLDDGEDWTPPPALIDFLQAGPAPIYIGFGSMSSRKPEETAELVIAALQLANQRAILLSGWSGLQKADVPDTVFMINSRTAFVVVPAARGRRSPRRRRHNSRWPAGRRPFGGGSVFRRSAILGRTRRKSRRRTGTGSAWQADGRTAGERRSGGGHQQGDAAARRSPGSEDSNRRRLGARSRDCSAYLNSPFVCQNPRPRPNPCPLAKCTPTRSPPTYRWCDGCSRHSFRSGPVCPSRRSRQPARTTRSTGWATTWRCVCRASTGPRTGSRRISQWLPRLAPHLPLAIPDPVAMGQPAEGYPWHWGIYRWLAGENATLASIADPLHAATTLAQFLTSLQQIDTTGGPRAADHGLRGVSLVTRDEETRAAIAALDGMIDVDAALAVWQSALRAPEWERAPVWFHGDLLPGNLLFEHGRLSAVIDFAGLGVGDPACDLMIAWGLFSGKSRDEFRAALAVDDATWARGRGMALSQALIFIPYYLHTNPVGVANARRAIDELLADQRAR